jgi:cell division septation protein DedD
MLALREQRRQADPGIQVAQLPAGPVVRMEPIPDGSTFAQPAAPTRTQLASAGGVVAMAPIASAGDFERRMEPIVSPGDTAASVQLGAVTRMDPVVSPGDPGTIRSEPLASPAARPAPGLLASNQPLTRGGLSLIPQAHAGTLPRAPTPASAPSGGGAWGVQVGAFASENLARDAANQARGRIGGSGTRTVVERVPQGRQTLYRARIIGLSSRNAADDACGRLRGGACMIVAPGA